MLQNFSSNFADSRKNKVWLDEFIEKYEQAALNHMSNKMNCLIK